MAYGRNVTAQKGAGIQYDRASSDARSYLEPGEVGKYEKNLGTMGRDRWGRGTGRNTWDGSRQHVSKLLKLDRLQREKADRGAADLRGVAATRALGDFRRAGMKTSKPWLQTASQGLITGESVSAPIDTDKLYWTRKKGPGAKDRMTKNQKRRVGDIAKYNNFQYDPVGLSGQASLGRPGDAPPAAAPVQGAPLAPPVDLGTPTGGTSGGTPDEETGTALQDLIDQIHKDNLAGLGGG